MALWSGSISFGLVSIPVRLETSKHSKSLRFNLLHGDCKTRIKQHYYCPTHEEYVERDSLVKGYEHQRDQYVILEAEDFEKAEGEASRNINVIAFVDRSDMKSYYLNKTYYLVPQDGGEKAYQLLLDGMRETDRMAIARFVMRRKEYIGAVDFTEGGLLLHTLFHKGELRNIEEVLESSPIAVTDKERELAIQIIENLSDQFSEEMLSNHYEDRLLAIIQQKVDGEEVTIVESAPQAKVVDLMDALKRSLELTASKKPSARVERASKASSKPKSKVKEA